MQNLIEYIRESLIEEGGASGHLAHIIDYTDLTLDNLKGIIYSLFNSRIEDVTEKLDGMNIQASMNNAGEVVFIRNKSDLNSERGGMSVADMAAKWSSKPLIQSTFVRAGEILERIFKQVGREFFNPDSETRIFANCECMQEGITNVIPYKSAMVNIHDLWIYKKTATGWEYESTTKRGLDKLEKHLDSESQLTPQVLIKTTEEGTAKMNSYFKTLNKMFKDLGLKNKSTLEEYQYLRFIEYVKQHYNWISEDDYGMFFDRLIKGVKSVNLREIKKRYPDHDLTSLDKDKDLKVYPNQELDKLMISLGNDVIKQCSGFLNSGFEEESIAVLKSDLEATVHQIEQSDNEPLKTKLMVNLNRLGSNTVNATEGIVFRYKGRLMKLTGSFACVNQIIGLKYNL